MGQWDRALTQLSLLPQLSPDTLLMARAGEAAIQCELQRKDVFQGKTLPTVFGEPDEWVGWLIRANQLGATGHVEEAGELRSKALDAAPAVSGTMNGQTFEWIADADPRLGPVLEAIIDGRYFWVPIHRISQLQIDPPKDLRDVVWCPAHFQWVNEGNAVGVIPTRYVGSDNPSDSAACLARKTDWIEGESGIHGIGQRVLVTDLAEYPILETRVITLNSQHGAVVTAEEYAAGLAGRDG